ELQGVAVEAAVVARVLVVEARLRDVDRAGHGDAGRLAAVGGRRVRADLLDARRDGRVARADARRVGIAARPEVRARGAHAVGAARAGDGVGAVVPELAVVGLGAAGGDVGLGEEAARHVGDAAGGDVPARDRLARERERGRLGEILAGRAARAEARRRPRVEAERRELGLPG